MRLKSAVASFCKVALTVTGLSVVAAMVVPSPAFSLPGINIPDIPSLPNVPSDLGDLINGGKKT